MYGHDAGHCYDPCGYGQTAPSYGYGYPSQVAGAATAPHGAGKGFALIVVLFILLIIVGASKYHC